ncbi:hypothetical protein [Methylobacterium radiodurans]|uniref:Lipoprotein n=1 Tax=Methylobacterium radiodurans TaxID=2202828 RepID=A0A2U8VSL0_9HYPH|nr:hypothetical protein [Methylobacterium radiodurans]AWN36779.1 hypothetical protein DK427_14410 [Methylobacterium radiodurans]
MCSRVLASVAVALLAGGCMGSRAAPDMPASGTARERLAALALRQVAFGSVSLIPVRFEHARISGPFEDAGRTLYCVSAHMKGRTFDKPEKPKIVVRADGTVLTVIEDDEVCTGHRTVPFPELEALGNRAG